MAITPFRSRYIPDRGLVLSGDIDELSVDALCEALESHAGPLVVDLAAVTHLASVGVGALVAAVRREEGLPVTLVAPEGSFAHVVLDMCGVPHWSAAPEHEADVVDAH
ncbi:STAS domain-containing protein [Nocardioides sp. zg-DK7169]|uniref:STAS domain-containing protein n=1 Tax=Nocardioides sp. zg-DK7169 TaxID=2736600 RepID=UPI0015566F89|nr:STAS domain-containing protein [Nocardioides sp. zg-DK7169]NPC98934.1 STAS domain-containing protein [Nocardioides sp. zg-DK7169]